MRGNAAILKCLIPSFVADFVQVTAWINDEGEEIIPGNDYSGGKIGRLQLCLTPLPENPFNNFSLIYNSDFFFWGNLSKNIAGHIS